MTEHTNYPARGTPSLDELSALALPVGEVAIERTLALANDAVLGCFPRHLRTAALSDRFITRARLRPVPQHQLAVRERADKLSDRMAIFAAVLAAGLPQQHADELIYSVRSDTRAYANIFLDKPELYFDEQLYHGFFSEDRGEREHATCVLGRVIIDVNLGAAPKVRALPRAPWQTILQNAVERSLLPSFRQLLKEAGTYHDDRFAKLVSGVGASFASQTSAEPARADELRTLRLINTAMNALFDADEGVEAVEWEPQQHRLVAHGAKVLFQRDDQVLPVFEFGTGVALDRETRTVFARQAVLAFYAKLQQDTRLPVVARHERDLLHVMTPMPAVYLQMGVRRSNVLEHYIRSDIPAWYLETMHSRLGNGSGAAVYPQ